MSVLSYRPKLMVLDEPLSGLDPLVRDELVETLIESASETTVFLSSHDLSEIENVASHVGFLYEGKLLCSEETQALMGRVRKVCIALEEPEALPAHLPESWLCAQSEGRVVSFVHRNYEENISEQEIEQILPMAKDVSIVTMSLREIIVALAKSAQQKTQSTKEAQA